MMRTTALQLLIPIFLRGVVVVSSLSTTTSSLNNNHALSAMDRVLALRRERNRAIRQHFLSDESMVQAMDNFEKIFEIPMSSMMIDYSVLKQDGQWSRALKPWASINRGSDLFLKGLGRFNIPEAYDKLVATREMEWKEGLLKFMRVVEMKQSCRLLGINASKKTRSELEIELASQSSTDVVQIVLKALRADTLNASLKSPRYGITPEAKKTYLSNLLQDEDSADGLPYWFVSVSLLQLWGYFGDVLEGMENSEMKGVESNLRCVLDLPEDSPQRQHFIQYHRSWSEQENLASLDEIRMNIESSDEFWPNGWERMKPSTLLSTLREHKREKKLARHGGDVTYSHLSDLEDAGSLRVLRTCGEVMDVGRNMKNCALSYAKNVELGHCILIAKYDNVKENKPIALGMINRNGNVLSERWSQIYMSCNRAAPEEVKQEFYEYEKVLRPWFRKKYMEKNGNE